MFKSHSGDGWTKSFLGQWLWIIGTRFIREDAWYKLHKYTLFFLGGGWLWSICSRFLTGDGE